MAESDPARLVERDGEAAVRDHLANERTLLAWQRTALGVVALGFLVARFAVTDAAPPLAATLLGVALVVLGGGVSLLGAYRFVRTERQIETGSHRPALVGHLAMTAAVVTGSGAVAVFLLATSA